MGPGKSAQPYTENRPHKKQSHKKQISIFRTSKGLTTRWLEENDPTLLEPSIIQ